ncbi:MAG TPA: glucosamine-6-phosphate deaminase [Sedimentisphaerales bacterium]|nr:glucosamine-6-phosphate deaminase [Sedimentisphaerales bacterium]
MGSPMHKYIYRNKKEAGTAAANSAAQAIRSAIRNKGQANIILATGASQFEMLDQLVASHGIDWLKVVMFHLDEYIGLEADHPAGFRKYLQERFVDPVTPLKAAYFVRGDAEDPAEECRRLGVLIASNPIDVACIGIGENGHLAFNDPPADFETEEAYLTVQLDEQCRKQQLGEGWFPRLEDVPSKAISMSIRQILQSRQLVVTVPDMRKARAVKNALEGPVTPQCPASILQQHPNCSIFLDELSASLLSSGQ